MDRKEQLLYENLEQYALSDAYPFHMPGHKRQQILFDKAYSIDITEIHGFDDLHHPEGILRQKMDEMAANYGADRSYYLVNGSTCGLLAAISAVTNLGDEILIARNSHKSVFNGVFLRNLKPHYVYPQILAEWWITGAILPQDVENSLKQNKKIRAVVIVSPTYEGIVSDIKSICEIAHQFGIPVIVDEAHGAHFSYGDLFPKSALECGADLIIQSLHKTLPALTQTALLHIKSALVDMEKVEYYLQAYQSSSPSYILMASIDACMEWMRTDGKKRVDGYYRRLGRFYRETEHLEHIWRLSPDLRQSPQAFDFDCSKLVFGSDCIQYSGTVIAEILRKRYRLEMEMCTPEYVIAMTSIADSEVGIERLIQALKEIDSETKGKQYNSSGKCKNAVPNAVAKAEVVLPPYEASRYETESVGYSEAKGMISGDMLYIYPPGIPFFMPGERITEETVKQLEYYRRNGLRIKGRQGMREGQILVLNDKSKTSFPQ